MTEFINHTKIDSYTLKKNEVLIDKPIYLGFTVLSKLQIYETYCDILQPYFGEKFRITLYEY